ncbi:Hypothetical_protein [Hexamita inflata]|uniref:Hypothetical_protein n=1 Tax=Hexamita inflata TaxID=28002 RepID=A0AA86PYL4_9EUKA|nr:Hypothetical protein HINF_LOCUS34901 [Hexamita inflata]
MSVKGYQVFGNYISSQSVALLAQIVITSNVSINSVIISTDVFTVGNTSSFMFSIISHSCLKIQSISISIGTMQYPNILSNIDSSNITFLQFGGLASFLNASNTQIIGVSIIQNDMWQTQYILASGYLIGSINSNTSLTQIQQVCVQYSIDSLSSNFSQYGAIGVVNGKFSMFNVNIFQQTNNGMFSEFGTIGITQTPCNIQLYQFTIQFIMNMNLGINVSSLIGSQLASEWYVRNININNSYIVGVRAGLVSGQTCNKGQLYNITIISSNVYSNATTYHSFAAAVIGFVQPYSQIQYKYIQVASTNINITSIVNWNCHAGTIIGELQPFAIVNISNIIIYNTSVSTNTNKTEPYAGGFVGKQLINTSISIDESQISYSNISAQQNYNDISFAGSYIGYSYASVHLVNISCVSVNIQCKAENQSWAGGIIGQMILTNVTVFAAKNITIQNINVQSSAQYFYAKLMVNFVEYGTYQITNSSTSGQNIINDIQVNNCLDIININTENGC